MLGVIVDEILIRNDCEGIGMRVVIIDDSSFYLWVDLSLQDFGPAHRLLDTCVQALCLIIHEASRFIFLTIHR